MRRFIKAILISACLGLIPSFHSVFAQVVTGGKKTPVITWANPQSISYGTALSDVQLNATSNTPGKFTYTPDFGQILEAGDNQTLLADFTPDDTKNYYEVKGIKRKINVKKANPKVTWQTPKPIKAGEPLGPDQLNASADVPGTFTYSPPGGIILDPGEQTLSVDFTPTDANNLNDINNTQVPITVYARPVITWPNPDAITYGTPLTAIQLNATANVPGTFTYTPPDGTVLNAGPDQTLTTRFVPTDSKNYDPADKKVKIIVNKAELRATASDASRIYGVVNPPLTISYSGFVSGDTPDVIDTPPIATTTATSTSPVGVYLITVASGSDNNYNFNYVPGTLTIMNGVPPTINDFQILVHEDTAFIFSYAHFGANFSSTPGDSIVSIKIVKTPSNGVLFSAGRRILPSDEIPVQHGVINDFSYVPNVNSGAFDTLEWNAADPWFYADQAAKLFIKTLGANDPPVLSNVENDPVLYALGDPAVIITQKLILSDGDDNFMYSARITVVDNYVQGDRLTLGPGAPSNLESTFDPATGELSLKGKESKSNYETALNNILFSSPVSEDSVLLDKKVSMVVNDSINDSNIESRIIRITKVFPELSLVNAFTPNSDGVNDYWDFVNLQFYSEINIAVFDQNGFRVFDCRDKDCKWGGKLNGKVLPVGPYFYSIYLERGKRSYRGTVTILK